MGLADRLKNLAKKAEDTAAGHNDQIHQAVQKAEAAADKRTGGKYHDKIAKAGDKADAYLDKQTQPGGPAGREQATPPKTPTGE